MEMKHVEGKNAKQLTLYTLSTCIWCKMTKDLLQKLGVAYDYIEVDMLNLQERDKALEEIKRFNPSCSFPSLIIDGNDCIVGFDEKKIKEVVG